MRLTQLFGRFAWSLKYIKASAGRLAAAAPSAQQGSCKACNQSHADLSAYFTSGQLSKACCLPQAGVSLI